MRLVLFIALAALAATASAQMYRWTDDKGKVHFSDTPPPASAKDVQRKSGSRGAGAGDASNAPEPFALQQARRDNPVTLYSTSECGEACDLARKLLNQRGVPFKDVRIANAEQLAELTRATGSNGVPAMTVGATVVKGFEEGAYHRALDSAGYPKTGILQPRTQAQSEAPKTDKPAETPAPAKGRYWSPGR